MPRGGCPTMERGSARPRPRESATARRARRKRASQRRLVAACWEAAARALAGPGHDQQVVEVPLWPRCPCPGDLPPGLVQERQGNAAGEQGTGAPPEGVAVGCRRPCRNGPACPWLASGCCRYFHAHGEVQAPPRLVSRRTLFEGDVQLGFEQLFAPWAAKVRAEALIVDDPYLAVIARSSPLYLAVADCEDEGSLPPIELAELEAATGLWKLRELVSVVNGCVPRLQKVLLRTRGDLLQDRAGRLHAGTLLRRWGRAFNESLAADHVHFELVIDPRLHGRRCLMQGRGHGAEIRCEWGLGYFQDAPDNLALPGPSRRVKRTEFLVFEFQGIGGVDAAASGTQNRRDRKSVV